MKDPERDELDIIETDSIDSLLIMARTSLLSYCDKEIVIGTNEKRDLRKSYFQDLYKLRHEFEAQYHLLGSQRLPTNVSTRPEGQKLSYQRSLRADTRNILALNAMTILAYVNEKWSSFHLESHEALAVEYTKIGHTAIEFANNVLIDIFIFGIAKHESGNEVPILVPLEETQILAYSPLNN